MERKTVVIDILHFLGSARREAWFLHLVSVVGCNSGTWDADLTSSLVLTRDSGAAFMRLSFDSSLIDCYRLGYNWKQPKTQMSSVFPALRTSFDESKRWDAALTSLNKAYIWIFLAVHWAINSFIFKTPLRTLLSTDTKHRLHTDPYYVRVWHMPSESAPASSPRMYLNENFPLGHKPWEFRSNERWIKKVLSIAWNSMWCLFAPQHALAKTYDTIQSLSTPPVSETLDSNGNKVNTDTIPGALYADQLEGQGKRISSLVLWDMKRTVMKNTKTDSICFLVFFSFFSFLFLTGKIRTSSTFCFEIRKKRSLALVFLILQLSQILAGFTFFTIVFYFRLPILPFLFIYLFIFLTV